MSTTLIKDTLKKTEASASVKPEEVKPLQVQCTHIGLEFPGDGRSIPRGILLLQSTLQRKLGYNEPEASHTGVILRHKNRFPIEISDGGARCPDSLWRVDDEGNMHLPVQNPDIVEKFFALFEVNLTQKRCTMKFIAGPETGFHVGLHVEDARELTRVKVKLVQTQVPELVQLASDLTERRQKGSGSGSGVVNLKLAGCGIEITYGKNGLVGHCLQQKEFSTKSEYPQGGYGGHLHDKLRR